MNTIIINICVCICTNKLWSMPVGLINNLPTVVALVMEEGGIYMKLLVLVHMHMRIILFIV